MRIGGHLDHHQHGLGAVLLSASAGITRFRTTRWHHSLWKCWVLDMTHGDQRQRIEERAEFVRAAGSAALYRPGLRYHEWQTEGGALYESWLLFTLHGELDRAFRTLIGSAGYCHFLDPDHRVTNQLRHISELVFRRRPGFALLAQGAFLELLGRISVAPLVSPCLREVRETVPESRGRDMPARIENYIRARISEPLRVADLAQHLKLSPSAFAHTYPAQAGETPYRTIARLKIEAAKRMLVDDGLTVKETAVRLGYPSEFQFSRAFKRLEGIAPNPYVLAANAKHRT